VAEAKVALIKVEQSAAIRAIGRRLLANLIDLFNLRDNFLLYELLPLTNILLFPSALLGSRRFSDLHSIPER
jgi:hypothetical protein